MSSTPRLERSRRRKLPLLKFTLPLLDSLTLATWGVLLLKYWLSNQLSLLIHPNYFSLVIATGFALLVLATLRMVQVVVQMRQRASGKRPRLPVAQHISLFPPGWGSALLLMTAILGLATEPTVFTSDTAMQRGLAESLTVTRVQPQAFGEVSKPEERSLIGWVRTLNVYPEPDAYTGQKVNVQGFVVHSPELPANYLLLSRFVITCCAADAYPVGLPVKLDQPREAYPEDSWLEVKGQMITETLNGDRQLTIEASAVKEIPKPDNPYEY